MIIMSLTYITKCLDNLPIIAKQQLFNGFSTKSLRLMKCDQITKQKNSDESLISDIWYKKYPCEISKICCSAFVKKKNKGQTYFVQCFNSFTASGHFCHLLITFANSLDTDQARQNVGPDLNPNCLTLWWYSLKIFSKKFKKKKKNPRTTKKHAKLPSMQRVKIVLPHFWK